MVERLLNVQLLRVAFYVLHRITGVICEDCFIVLNQRVEEIYERIWNRSGTMLKRNIHAIMNRLLNNTTVTEDSDNSTPQTRVSAQQKRTITVQ